MRILLRSVLSNFLLKKCKDRAFDLTGWPLEGQKSRIDNSVHSLMEEKVTDTEIWEAILCMGFNHTPSINGITTSFYKSFWNIVDQSVREASKAFFCSSVMPNEWKGTLVVFISQGIESDYPSKFKQISLCHTIYEVVAKILVNQLKNVLPSIISEEQWAFILGRGISHPIHWHKKLFINSSIPPHI